VITYRSRAYEKLGIRSRRELFSSLLRNRATSSHWQRTEMPGNPPGFNLAGPHFSHPIETSRYKST
jgi:hypothetical protein